MKRAKASDSVWEMGQLHHPFCGGSHVDRRRSGLGKLETSAPPGIKKLAAVLNSRYPKLELIVVDDGFTDDFEALAERVSCRLLLDSGGHPRARADRDFSDPYASQPTTLPEKAPTPNASQAVCVDSFCHHKGMQ